MEFCVHVEKQGAFEVIPGLQNRLIRKKQGKEKTNRKKKNRRGEQRREERVMNEMAIPE